LDVTLNIAGVEIKGDLWPNSWINLEMKHVGELAIIGVLNK